MTEKEVVSKVKKYPKGGPDLHEVRKSAEHARNKGIMASEVFVKACSMAGIEPSLRQASKFKHSKGKVFTFKNLAVLQLKEEKNN
jgi:hypothetical protein